MLSLQKAKSVDSTESRQEKKADMSPEEMKNVISDIKKMTNSSNMKSVVGTLNVERKRSKFYDKVEMILSRFDNIKLDDDNEKIKILFLFVLQSANDYLHEDSEEKRQEMCVQLLKRFVKDDEYIAKSIMNIVKANVKPLSYYRRFKHCILRIGRFFLSKAVRAS